MVSAEDRLSCSTPLLHTTLNSGGNCDHPCGGGAGLLALTPVDGLGAATEYLLDSVGDFDV